MDKVNLEDLRPYVLDEGNEFLYDLFKYEPSIVSVDSMDSPLPFIRITFVKGDDSILKLAKDVSEKAMQFVVNIKGRYLFLKEGINHGNSENY